MPLFFNDNPILEDHNVFQTSFDGTEKKKPKIFGIIYQVLFLFCAAKVVFLWYKGFLGP